MFKTCRNLTRWLLGVGLLWAAAAGAQPPSGLPDLDIVTLSRSPRVNAESPPARRGRRSPIEWTARVVNHGRAPSAAFHFTWFVDGKAVQRGSHAPLPGGYRPLPARTTPPVGRLAGAPVATGGFDDLRLSVRRRKAPYVVRLQVTPARSGASETTFANNAREARSDSLGFLVTVSEADYDRAGAQLNAVGSRSFEDWAQWHFARLRRAWSRSAYDDAPDGATLRVRLDEVRVLAAGATVAPEAALAAGWQGVWRSRLPASGPLTADTGFLTAVHRQLWLRPTPPLSPADNHARDPQTDAPLRVGFQPRLRLPDALGETALYPEYSVLWLNHLDRLMAGKREARTIRRPWQALPRTVRVQPLDNNGRPVPAARIALFQRREGGIPAKPMAGGETDAGGQWTLPNRPGEPWANPFGDGPDAGSEGLLLLRIRARGQADSAWLPITRVNAAFWQGQRGLAILPLPTHIPDPKAPAPPETVTLTRVGDARRLEWPPVATASVVAYRLYRADPPAFAYQLLRTVSSEKRRYQDAAPPAAESRYAVTAVDANGNESAFALPGGH